MKKDRAKLLLKKALDEYEFYKKESEDMGISKEDREYNYFMSKYYRGVYDGIKIVYENIL